MVSSLVAIILTALIAERLVRGIARGKVIVFRRSERPPLFWFAVSIQTLILFGFMLGTWNVLHEAYPSNIGPLPNYLHPQPRQISN
jgi:hypothetical protein